ncbi:hypothetical protein ACVGV4_08225, partial [Enterobacter hormaechei]
GGGYRKPALAWPYAFFAKNLPGILQESSALYESPYPSAQQTDRAQRVSERRSGISPVSHILLTHGCRLLLLPHEELN